MVADGNERWAGYFDPYLAKARDRQVSVLQILDTEWADGLQTASTAVLPYLNPTDRVLEIGCGVGRVSRFVAGHCQHLTCSDILEQALDGCRQALAAHSNVDYVRTSGRDLQGFADASVDVVYSFTTFFHFDFELVVQYFAEIRRVLRSGGRSILEFKRWNGSDDVVQLLQKIQHCGGLSQYAAAVDKWRYVSRDTLALLCRYYGFVVLNDDTTRFTMAIPE